MLMYYLPGLEVSKISEQEFVQRLAHLNTIRKMEQNDSVNKVLKNAFGE